MLLQLQQVSKSFAGVTALKEVSMHFNEGEVHALCGENGAGKSTLMNILSGTVQPTQGKIFLRQQLVSIQHYTQAKNLGIAIVHQERSLSESLNIAENIFAGRQPVNKWGLIDYKTLYKQTAALLQRLQLPHLLPTMLVKNLSAAQQQMIEIAKALSTDPAILILDEPTATVTEKETAVLFEIIRNLKLNKVAVIYISHRLREIFTIADKVSVLKDGVYQGTKNISDTNTKDLIKMMVGREIKELPANRNIQPAVALKVENLCGEGFNDISFSIRQGEIAGFAGLVGAGRTEIARAIFGASKIQSGRVIVNGENVQSKNTKAAIKNGIGYIPEDRKLQGAFLEMSIAENIIAARPDSATLQRLFSFKKMFSIAEGYKQRLKIATTSVKQFVKNLSGGNQQKAVIAKWLLVNPDILIADEPTQGVDVGARFEIYELLQQEAAKGKAVLLISSDMPELLQLCDIIYVIRSGRLVASFNRTAATEEKIMQAAASD